MKGTEHAKDNREEMKMKGGDWEKTVGKSQRQAKKVQPNPCNAVSLSRGPHFVSVKQHVFSCTHSRICL